MIKTLLTQPKRCLNAAGAIMAFMGLGMGLSPSANAAQYDTFLTVAKDGSAEYTSIQSAIDATKTFPYEPITIFVKAGTYHEKVEVYSWNTQVSLIGEDKDTTIITQGDHFDGINKGRNSTFHTYTLKVAGNDFTAKNLTVVNSAGPVGQAVALHVEADRAVFENVALKGWQDTLYVAGEGHRSYFRHCTIEGSVDFIFGGGTAFFEQCEIKSLLNSYITAASTPRHQPYGFVFDRCTLTAAAGVDKVYLGRPWREYAKTVFLNSQLGAHILPAGWHNWDREENERKVTYAEFNNSGPGSEAAQRVEWSSQLSKRQAKRYRKEAVLGDWQPH